VNKHNFEYAMKQKMWYNSLLDEEF